MRAPGSFASIILMRHIPAATWCFVSLMVSPLAFAESLPDTKALEISGDISATMVDGIGRWLDREIAKTSATRLEMWKTRVAPDAETVRKPEAEKMRKLLRQRLGMTDESLKSRFEVLQSPTVWPMSPEHAALNGQATYRALHLECLE